MGGSIFIYLFLFKKNNGGGLDYILTSFWKILNLEGHPNHITASRVRAILLIGLSVCHNTLLYVLHDAVGQLTAEERIGFVKWTFFLLKSSVNDDDGV